MSLTEPLPSPIRGADAAGVPIVYIAGLHRSGTTLLGRLLAESQGGAFVGELEILWRRGVLEDRLCGCGVAFSACPFWRAVGDAAFGGWTTAQATRMVALREQLARRRYVGRVQRGSGPATWRGLFREYADATAELYRAAHHIAQRPLVDSSKTPTHAATLSSLDQLALRLVHIVRDSRGVAFSKTKTKALLDKPGAMHERFPPARTGVDWLRDNLLIERVARGAVATARLRYEQLAQQPAETVDRVVQELGMVREPGSSVPATMHSVAGNPMRFSGDAAVRLDDEWRTRMPSRDRIAVVALTWPLLVRYGFVRAR